MGALSLRPLLLCQRLYTYSSQREFLYKECGKIIPILGGRVNQGQFPAQSKLFSPAGMGTASWLSGGGRGQCQREL